MGLAVAYTAQEHKENEQGSYRVWIMRQTVLDPDFVMLLPAFTAAQLPYTYIWPLSGSVYIL